jgi:hypothetical protein
VRCHSLVQRAHRARICVVAWLACSGASCSGARAPAAASAIDSHGGASAGPADSASDAALREPPAPSGGAVAPAVAATPDSVADGPAATASSSAELPRGAQAVYASSPLVGRLAIELGNEVVSVDHPFHDGDGIRFVVSSSESGWLFVYHADHGHKMELLWPESGVATAENFVTKGGELRVPSRGSIEFDSNTGDERFSVILVERPLVQPKEERQRPAESHAAPVRLAQTPPVRRSTPNADPDEVVQIRVRGGLEVHLRGVRLAPAPSRPFVEFQAMKGDDGTVASVNFQLKHVH